MSTLKSTTPNSHVRRQKRPLHISRFGAVTAAAALSTLLLAGCSGVNTPQTEEGAERTQHTTEENHGELKLTQAWAKAANTGDMTSVFGTLDNGTDMDAHITEVNSDVSEAVELHETYLDEDGTTKMREIDGGFVVPAHDTFELEPGASHIMLMNLNQDLLAGDTLTLELQLADGSAHEVTAEIRDFAGANENYDDVENHSGDHEHSE